MKTIERSSLWIWCLREGRLWSVRDESNSQYKLQFTDRQTDRQTDVRLRARATSNDKQSQRLIDRFYGAPSITLFNRLPLPDPVISRRLEMHGTLTCKIPRYDQVLTVLYRGNTDENHFLFLQTQHSVRQKDPFTKTAIYSTRCNSFLRNFKRLLRRKFATDLTSFMHTIKVCVNGTTFRFWCAILEWTRLCDFNISINLLFV